MSDGPASSNRVWGVRCSYCGDLDWTIRNYGRVTHKVACPHRTEPWSQQEPHADSAEFNRRPLADDIPNSEAIPGFERVHAADLSDEDVMQALEAPDATRNPVPNREANDEQDGVADIRSDAGVDSGVGAVGVHSGTPESLGRATRNRVDEDDEQPDCAYCRGSGLSPHSIRDISCPYCGGA